MRQDLQLFYIGNPMRVKVLNYELCLDRPSIFKKKKSDCWLHNLTSWALGQGSGSAARRRGGGRGLSKSL